MHVFFRRSTIIGSLLLMTIHALGQNNQPQTLFASQGTNKNKLGFFVAPSIGFTKMDGAAATLQHVRAGVSLHNKFSAGLYYSGSLNDIRSKSEPTPNVYLDYRSFGGFVEYTAWANRLVHVTFPLMVGWGEVEYDREEGAANLGEANLFQVEPAALVELNLHKHLRLHGGAGYRFVGNMTYRNLDQSNISGLTVYLGLRIGLFR